MSGKTSCLSNSSDVQVSLPLWGDEMVLKTHLDPKVWCYLVIMVLAKNNVGVLIKF